MTESWECGTLFDNVNTDEGSLAIGAPGQVALTRVANVIRKATEYVLVCTCYVSSVCLL